MDFVAVVSDLRARMARVEALGAARWGATAPEAWHLVGSVGEPAFTGTWANFGSTFQVARFRKIGDVVQIEGLVKNGAAATSVFTLPAGYRPVADHTYASVVQPNSTLEIGRITIASAGTISPTLSGTAGYVSLNFTFTVS